MENFPNDQKFSRFQLVNSEALKVCKSENDSSLRPIVGLESSELLCQPTSSKSCKCISKALCRNLLIYLKA